MQHLKPLLRLLVLLPSAILVAACAGRTDARVREAWEHSQRSGPGGPSTGPGGPTGSDPGEPGGPARDGIEGFVAQGAEVLALAPGQDAIARLAQQWCSVEPEPKESPHGPVYVCYPQPPIVVADVSLTLELGLGGVIGLVADELSDQESRDLVERARQTTGPQCEQPWNAVVGRDGEGRELTFHTCPAKAGPTLTIGRIPHEESGTWQVSIAILGAG